MPARLNIRKFLQDFINATKHNKLHFYWTNPVSLELKKLLPLMVESGAVQHYEYVTLRLNGVRIDALKIYPAYCNGTAAINVYLWAPNKRTPRRFNQAALTNHLNQYAGDFILVSTSYGLLSATKCLKLKIGGALLASFSST